MPSRIASALSSFGREALRIVLPSWCVACGTDLAWSARVASCCAACWSALPKIERAKCISCALPLPSGAAGFSPPNDDVGLKPDAPHCIACSKDPLPLAWCEAWGEYRGSLEKVLHALKFERHDFLDDALAPLLEESLRDREFDVVLGVPMHAAKERKRGYNQAELLARALARRIEVPCDMLLTRRRELAAQSLLPKQARAANVRGAFHASPRAKGQSILIVDDICTTGETLRACAKALLRAGASRVCAVAVAKTL
ncbi:MAG TPA: ComF family protein [Thermoanaerobaculia bacterium]|nr:ComF family protein [Thermoanaerobaculia bacterium]